MREYSPTCLGVKLGADYVYIDIVFKLVWEVVPVCTFFRSLLCVERSPFCGMDCWFVSILEWHVEPVVQAAASRSLSAVDDAQLLASKSRGWRSKIVYNALVAVVRSALLRKSSALPWILWRILRLHFISMEGHQTMFPWRRMCLTITGYKPHSSLLLLYRVLWPLYVCGLWWCLSSWVFYQGWHLSTLSGCKGLGAFGVVLGELDLVSYTSLWIEPVRSFLG